MRQNSPPHRVNRMTANATISKHAALTAQVSRIHRDDAPSSWPQSIDGVNFSIAGSPPSTAYRSTQYGESALTTQPLEGSLCAERAWRRSSHLPPGPSRTTPQWVELTDGTDEPRRLRLSVGGIP